MSEAIEFGRMGDLYFPKYPLVCVYCGIETSGSDENLEHVLPEFIGNSATLYRGAVCNTCNRNLGHKVEGRVFEEPMFAAGLVNAKVEGKRGAKSEVSSGKGKVRRSKTGLTISDAVSGEKNQHDVSRMLAKMAVNHMVSVYGSSAIRSRFPKLVQFVKQPKNKNDVWPYEASYMILGNRVESMLYDHSGIPVIISNEPAIFVIIFSSGIFAVPLQREPENGRVLAIHLVEDFAESVRASMKYGGYIMRFSG